MEDFSSLGEDVRDDEKKATSANTHWNPKYPANWRFLFLTRNSKCTNETKDPPRWNLFPS